MRFLTAMTLLVATTSTTQSVVEATVQQAEYCSAYATSIGGEAVLEAETLSGSLSDGGFVLAMNNYIVPISLELVAIESLLLYSMIVIPAAGSASTFVHGLIRVNANGTMLGSVLLDPGVNGQDAWCMEPYSGVSTTSTVAIKTELGADLIIVSGGVYTVDVTVVNTNNEWYSGTYTLTAEEPVNSTYPNDESVTIPPQTPAPTTSRPSLYDNNVPTRAPVNRPTFNLVAPVRAPPTTPSRSPVLRYRSPTRSPSYKYGYTSPTPPPYVRQAEAESSVGPIVVSIFLIVGALLAGFFLYKSERMERARRERGSGRGAIFASATSPIVPQRPGAARPPPQRSTSVPPRPRPTAAAAEADLIRGMTAQQRRQYVKNFLKTEKFTNAAMAKISTSGRFIVQPSRRNVMDDSTAAAASSPTCAICLEEFAEGENVCSSQNKHCPHQYHMSCAFEWLMTHQDCPCCRRDYLTIGQTSSRSINDGYPLSPPTLLVTPTAPNEEDIEADLRDAQQDWRSLVYALNIVREDVGGLVAVAEDDCPTTEEDGEDDNDGGGDGGGD